MPLGFFGSELQELQQNPAALGTFFMSAVKSHDMTMEFYTN